MITERKAIAAMFDDLQEEKRQLKTNYRHDLAQIESRQERLLERLERLDKLDRDEIDIESTITDLMSLTEKISGLIPDIPANVLLEKTAEKMAAASMEGNGPKILVEKKEEPEPVINLKEAPGISPKPSNMKDTLYAIADALQDKYLTAREIEEILKDKYGWEWASFTASFSNWRTKHPNIILQSGRSYTSALYNREKKQIDHNESDKIAVLM